MDNSDMECDDPMDIEIVDPNTISELNSNILLPNFIQIIPDSQPSTPSIFHSKPAVNPQFHHAVRDVPMWSRSSTPETVMKIIDALHLKSQDVIIADLLNISGQCNRDGLCAFDADPAILYNTIVQEYLAYSVRKRQICVGVVRCLKRSYYNRLLSVLKKCVQTFSWMRFVVTFNDCKLMQFDKYDSDGERNLYCYRDIDDRICLLLSRELQTRCITNDLGREYEPKSSRNALNMPEYNPQYDCMYDTEVVCIDRKGIIPIDVT